MLMFIRCIFLIEYTFRSLSEAKNTLLFLNFSLKAEKKNAVFHFGINGCSEVEKSQALKGAPRN